MGVVAYVHVMPSRSFLFRLRSFSNCLILSSLRMCIVVFRMAVLMISCFVLNSVLEYFLCPILCRCFLRFFGKMPSIPSVLLNAISALCASPILSVGVCSWPSPSSVLYQSRDGLRSGLYLVVVTSVLISRFGPALFPFMEVDHAPGCFAAAHGFLRLVSLLTPFC